MSAVMVVQTLVIVDICSLPTCLGTAFEGITGTLEGVNLRIYAGFL